MVALQKKQSLLFIRCWLMQALQQEGEGARCPSAPGPAPPPAPGGPLTCRTCGHRAGTRPRWGARSRWGRGPPRWWAAGSTVQGGHTPSGQPCVQATAWPCGGGPTHQGGRCGLGRRRGQVCQHLLHLGQLLAADVVCVWGVRSVRPLCSQNPGPPEHPSLGQGHSRPGPPCPLTALEGEALPVRGRQGSAGGGGLRVPQKVADGAELEAGVRQEH